MKRILKYLYVSSFCLLVVGTSLVAQGYRSSSSAHYSRVDNTKFHYGYSIGFGVFDYRVQNTRYGGRLGFLAEPVHFSPALRLGVIGEWRITNYIALRTVPGLFFGKREILYNREDIRVDGINEFTDAGYPLSKNVEVKSIYADIPLMFKYSGQRINNYNLYLLAGASYHMDLTPHRELLPEENRVIRTKMHDFALEVGAGIDLYFKYFKLGTELRISIGLVDVMNHNVVEDMPDYYIYTESIESLKSTMVTLSFNFE